MSSVETSLSVGVIAAIPPFTVWVISKQFFKEIGKILVPEKTAEAFIRIKFNQGSKRFYDEYDSDYQEYLNDLDEKFFVHILNVLSGVVTAVFLLIFSLLEYSQYGYLGVLAALGLAACTVYALSIVSYKRMHELIEYSVQRSKVSNEA